MVLDTWNQGTGSSNLITTTGTSFSGNTLFYTGSTTASTSITYSPEDYVITFGSGTSATSTNTFSFDGSFFSNQGWVPYIETAKERVSRLRDAIRAKMAPMLLRTRAHRECRTDFTQISQAEMRALHLLKGMLSDSEWRRYLKYGFVTTKGPSGLEYQINRGEHHVFVFRRGVKVAELCIYAKKPIPPTDQVITKKIMLECDEIAVWHRANIYPRTDFLKGANRKPEMKELIELAA